MSTSIWRIICCITFSTLGGSVRSSRGWVTDSDSVEFNCGSGTNFKWSTYRGCHVTQNDILLTPIGGPTVVIFVGFAFSLPLLLDLAVLGLEFSRFELVLERRGPAVPSSVSSFGRSSKFDFHTKTSSSLPHEAKRVPSRLNCTQLTGPSWPWSV